MIRVFFTVLFVLLAGNANATPTNGSDKPDPICQGQDQACLFNELEKSAAAITEEKWRDIAYRELAKSLAETGQTERAISLISKIINPDTQALTIRGIGMGAAKLNWAPEKYSDLFTQLTSKAMAIEHTPSKEIALTYICMAQAFARMDDDAVKTAQSMTNPALRHKALGEMAEIQAERSDAVAALKTLNMIDSEAYKSKSARTITILLSDRQLFDDAAKAAALIKNPTLKAEALQYMITRQINPAPDKAIQPKEVSHD